MRQYKPQRSRPDPMKDKYMRIWKGVRFALETSFFPKKFFGYYRPSFVFIYLFIYLLAYNVYSSLDRSTSLRLILAHHICLTEHLSIFSCICLLASILNWIRD